MLGLLSKIKNSLKNSFPGLLNVYYKIRFLIRSFYILETRDHLKWKITYGDKSKHKKYNLNSESVFFDVGGYTGEFTDKIIKEFDCYSFIFEPLPTHYPLLKKKYLDNKKVKVFNYGLFDITSTQSLTEELESSKITNDKNSLSIEVRDIVEVINDLEIEKIDLMKLNIEGAEYKLLDRIIKTGLVSKVESFQIQYHKDGVPNPELNRKRINNELSKTHSNIWSYYFVWERWDKFGEHN